MSPARHRSLTTRLSSKECLTMKRKKTIGVVLFGAGAVILILSLVADPIGIGGSLGFGWKQMLGALIGAGLTVLGLVLGYRM